MNGLRRMLGIVFAVALALVALPAAAQSKIYSLNISSTTSSTTTAPTIPSGVASTLYAIVKNETPNGNSNWNALVLTAPQGITINAAGTSTPNGQLSVAANGQSLTISNMSPVKPLQSVTITLSVTANVIACTTTTNLLWSVVPWTGSQPGSGQPFNLAPTPTLPYQPYTNVGSSGCSYSIAADLGAVPAGSAATTLNMTLKNTSAGAVPAITSLTSLNVPGALMVTGVSGAGVTASGNVVSITGLSLSAGQSFAFTITVKTAPSCTGSGPFAWTSSVSPAGFTGSNPSTTITSTGCSLSISSSPANVGAGDPFSVTVTLNGGPGGGKLNLTSNCSVTPSSVAVSGNSATFNITIAQTDPPVAQNCTINVASDQPGYGQTSLTYNNVYGGVLGCDNTSNFDSSNGNVLPNALDPNQDIAFLGDVSWGLRRGPNSVGPPPTCVKVNYTFTLGPGNISNLVYDKSSGQSATFKYVVIWKPVDVDQVPNASSGWTIFRPQVSWGIANPQPGTSDYVPALACVMDEPDLTTLSAAQVQALLPVIPSVPPFLGNPNAQYQPGLTAKMCIAQQGVTAIGQDPNYPNDPTKILIQFWDKVIDESDGHLQGP
jgi:hypothetical protein